jgi:hypothetical protein
VTEAPVYEVGSEIPSSKTDVVADSITFIPSIADMVAVALESTPSKYPSTEPTLVRTEEPSTSVNKLKALRIPLKRVAAPAKRKTPRNPSQKVEGCKDVPKSSTKGSSGTQDATHKEKPRPPIEKDSKTERQHHTEKFTTLVTAQLRKVVMSIAVILHRNQATNIKPKGHVRMNTRSTTWLKWQPSQFQHRRRR